MKAWVFGGMVVLSAALAACSSSSSDDGAGGGTGGSAGDGGSTGDGGAGSTTNATTGTTTPATTSTTTTTSTGGEDGVCGTGLTFDQGGPTDTCIEGSCCTEFTACAGADGSNSDACNACLEAGGGALCDSFLACAGENCGSDEDGVCGTGLTFDQGGPTDTCIEGSCCTEFTACAGAAGENADACNACLEAGSGPLCDDFLACADTNCSGGEGVCGTGLTFDEGGPLDTCIDDNCCPEFTACAGADGENADACNACLEAEGGPLCDDFLACANDSCG